MEVLFNGCLYSVNNKEGYDIGVGYGCGNKKEFYYPYSQSMEHSYCHVTTEQINKVVEELEKQGYEFTRDEEYVFMKGERKPFKPFQPSKPHHLDTKRKTTPNPNVNPVDYYSNRLFTNSKNGDLHLF